MNDDLSIKLTDFNNYIRNHGTTEVKSSFLYEGSSSTPKMDGLISPRIFGDTTEERRTKMGFINLKKPFLHPLIYSRVIRRSYREIDALISGSKKYKISSRGELVEDPNGETGMDFLYENFSKIEIRNLGEDYNDESTSYIMRQIRKLPKVLDKNNIFIDKFLVMPLLYRDVLEGDGSRTVDIVNDYYKKIIQMVSNLGEDDGSLFLDQNMLRFRIQKMLVSLFDFLVSKVYGKYGVQRKKAMTKIPDYSAGLVIGAPNYDGDSFFDYPVNLESCGYPLSSVASMFEPFVSYNIEAFLRSLYDSGQMTKIDGSNPSEEDFQEMYSKDKIKNDIIKKYINSWGERLKPLLIPGTEDEYIQLHLSDIDGKENNNIVRNMTITDSVYIGSYLGTIGRNALGARYPIQDDKGVFPTKVHVLSSLKTLKCTIDGLSFDYYPDIDNLLDEMNSSNNISEVESKLTSSFDETMTISNLFLSDIEGDYDGDMCAVRSIFSDEANEEIDSLLTNSFSTLFNYRGKNTKFIKREAVQSIYQITKKPYESDSKYHRASKLVDDRTISKLLDVASRDLTVSFIMKELGIGDFMDKPATYDYNDYFVLPKNQFPNTNKNIKTTIGRYIVNKLFFYRLAQFGYTEYLNETMTGKVLSSKFDEIGNKILDSKNDIDIYKEMLSVYEVFGLKMSSHVTPSYSINMLDVDKSIKERREALFRKYKDDLESGNVQILDKITEDLLVMVEDIYGEDPMFDFYRSGSNKRVGDNYAKYALLFGAVPTDVSGTSFTYSLNNYLDGIKKDEIHKIDNSAILGGYFRAKNTAVGGYQGKIGVQITQSTKIGKRGSDCKTDGYRLVKITKDNFSEYIGLYIMLNGSPKKLKYENIDAFIGETVKLRSPIYCKSKDNFCNICGGDIYHDINGVDDEIEIGVSLKKPFTELNQKSMKKTHSMKAKYYKIDNLNDYLSDIPIK